MTTRTGPTSVKHETHRNLPSSAKCHPDAGQWNSRPETARLIPEYFPPTLGGDFLMEEESLLHPSHQQKASQQAQPGMAMPALEERCHLGLDSPQHSAGH